MCATGAGAAATVVAGVCGVVAAAACAGGGVGAGWVSGVTVSVIDVVGSGVGGA